MDQNYKARKEEFVSDLSGGSISEIVLVILVAPAAALLCSVLQSRQQFFTPYGPTAVVVDFLLNVGAILFATTAYSSAPALLNVLLCVPAALIFLLPKHGQDAQRSSSPISARTYDGEGAKSSPIGSANLPVRPFLTVYRGSMMIITCLAILAVDFRVFPRRFAKVENWGTSLMDLGVGSFVFSAGVVSARSTLRARSAVSRQPPSSFTTRFVSSVRHSLPLFLLGLIRLYSVKGLDYAEHVTEYGVHWNFFFTLALLPPFVEFSDTLTTSVVSYEVLSVLLATIYQILLDNTILKSYILISPRGPDLLSKNREGVFSFCGYLSIFLAGRGTGSTILSNGATNIKPSPKRTKVAARDEIAWKDRKDLLRKMVIRSLVWTLLFSLSTAYVAFGLRVSRRLANLPYVLGVSAFNNGQLLLFCLIETAVTPEAYKTEHTEPTAINNSTSRIMTAFNTNGLAIFLIANLLTGAVNLSVKTLDVRPLGAMAILVAYAACLTGLALALDMRGIKIKL